MHSSAWGEAHKFLGMRVEYSDENGYHLDQEVTIADMVKEHGMEDVDGADESAEELLPSAGRADAITVSKFQSLVGSLLGACVQTSPLPYARRRGVHTVNYDSLKTR
ncbi:hypothetical protein PHMEG_0003244 [Phytophthora megakarya]|uniref:Uncharacterized protein n=1 Tax=Phytophthora megakarya TaxID=4795 RepID=A0A225WX33_9STRA|nr:hypothetical protein PHMEG_0003244 [Phytophthora megakarya]